MPAKFCFNWLGHLSFFQSERRILEITNHPPAAEIVQNDEMPAVGEFVFIDGDRKHHRIVVRCVLPDVHPPQVVVPVRRTHRVLLLLSLC